MQTVSSSSGRPLAARRSVWLLAALVLAAVGAAAPAAAAEVTVYWERATYWPGTAFSDFTAATGIAVNFPVKGETSEALEALRAEAASTRADLVVTNDLGHLVELARLGLLAPVESRALGANVPAHLRDPEHRWFGIAVRVRTIVYSTERVRPSELSTYAALGDPKWKGRLCLRTSQSHYTSLLLGSWITRDGKKRTEQIVKGWLANRPQIVARDRDLLNRIAFGDCDVAVAHAYYLARELAKDPAFPVGLFWPDQDGAGVHATVAATGVVANGANRAHAVRLLEYLTTAEVQPKVVDANFEYPVHPEARPHPLLAKWGPFKMDRSGVAAAAELSGAALDLAKRLGYR